MAQHTVKKIVGVMILNLMIMMAFAYSPTNESIEARVNSIIGLSVNEASILEEGISGTNESNEMELSGIFNTTGSSDYSYAESRLNIGNIFNVMGFILFAGFVPYGSLINLITNPVFGENIITLVMAWAIFLVVLAVNISMYIRVIDKVYSKFAE